MDLAARKRALRRDLAARRRGVPRSEAERAGRAAAVVLADTPEFQAASQVALYAALPDELPTRAIFERVVASDRVALLPRCSESGGLEFVPVARWEELRPGRYGVLEPDPGVQAGRLGAGDLVLLPGVGFDARGARLGRGEGYYDRAFPPGPGGGVRERGPVLFGVAYALQVVPCVPCGPADRRVDAVVSENGIVRVKPAERAP